MSHTDDHTENLVLEFELDAPRERVWRALSIPEFRERWLPDLADADPVSATPEDEISYRMREREPPFLESLVAFRLQPGEDGGTILTIVHAPVETEGVPPAANGNEPEVMRAA